MNPCKSDSEGALGAPEPYQTRRIRRPTEKYLCYVAELPVTATAAQHPQKKLGHSHPKTEVQVQKVKKKRSQSDVGVGAHKCDLCGRYYSSKSNLKRHSVIHIMNPRNSVGSPKGTTTYPNRNKKKKKPSQKCPCPQCGLLLSSHRCLNRHLLVHNDSRPYACRYCVWTFKRRDTLANHLKRLHKKSDTVARSMSLAVRRKLNNGIGNSRLGNRQKPARSGVQTASKRQTGAASRHQCLFCGRRFFDAFSLNRHLLLHTNEKPYSCPKCPLTHNRKDGLTSHIRRCKHGEVSTGGDLPARQVQRVSISTAVAPFRRKHSKSKKLARSMSHGAVGKSGYNMRNRDKAPTPPAIGSTSVENNLAMGAPLSAPKLPVKKSHTIVMVGDIKFSTPRLMRRSPTQFQQVIQGCETYEQWFWKDYYKCVEEMCTAPLIKTEPQYDLSLTEMAELMLEN